LICNFTDASWGRFLDWIAHDLSIKGLPMTSRATHHIGNKPAELKRAHAFWQKGVELSKRKDWHEAAAQFERACKAVPNDVLYRLNLARALYKEERYEEAVRQARRILTLDATQILARRLAGESLVKMGSHTEAVELLLAGREHVGQDFDYLYALGQALQGAGRFQEGISVFMEAISHKVDHAQSFYHLAMCFHGLSMRRETVECLETVQVLGVEKGEMACDSLLAFIRRECLDWDKAERDLASLKRRVMEAPDDERQWLSVFGSVVLTDDPVFQRKAAQICARNMKGVARPLADKLRPPQGRKLRLGFVSADFHHHATTILMAELLERLDPDRFELHLYSHGPNDGSAMRQRIQLAAHSFVEVAAMSDHDVARRIVGDQIDVLVDLKGHTSRSRLGIFAWRPAPIQVSFLGFPGTTGADFIDYVIGDPITSPIAHAADFTEKLAQMPVCYQPNDRLRPLPAPTTRAAHGLPDDALVLCGFNQPFKISPEVMDVWCGLLQDLPHAVLWLLKWTQESAEPLMAEARKRGIAPERIVLAAAVPNAEHLSRFALADLYLDAWPCNGHTTVSDALWAGVPVVTLQGRTFVARVASSLLHAVGLNDCVTHDVDAYRAKVLSLANDAAQRQQLRQHLVAARATAPLFDADRYAADFGALIERMVDRGAQGQQPDHLPA
jgi:predicted O-linked N-acetylglucosamine transferase (SPINDLY family)